MAWSEEGRCHVREELVESMHDSGIFGLSKSEVLPILGTACGQKVREYRVSLRKRNSAEGICGEYLFATFRAETESGASVEVPMFVRRQLSRSIGKRQAHHHAFLASQGVPVPCIYGSVIDDAEREIIRRITADLLAAMRSLPVGLVHSDLRPGNTGWRRQDRQLVVLDFEDILLDARFYDVAQVLGGPRPLLPGAKSNADLAELFLHTYSELGGDRVDMNTSMDEIEIAWAARKVNLWQYLPPEYGGPSYENRAFERDAKRRRGQLHRQNPLVSPLAGEYNGAR